jgi:hypothetical protein
MTQEKKDLLIKDLCARLPYNVKIETLDGPQIFDIRWLSINMCNIANPYLPYLFPLSSMTQEQESYLDLYTNFKIDMFGNLSVKDSDYNNGYANISLYDCTTIINWLLENHFDIYGLIPMGLAIDATGLNIY